MAAAIWALALVVVGPLIGGGLVILSNWIADKRKYKANQEETEQRERALLTGMFAVRNHIAQGIVAWRSTGKTAQLEPLRSALLYLDRD